MEPSTLLSGIIELLRVIIWPLVVVFILVFFKDPIGGFLGNMRKSSIKVGKEGVAVELDATKAEVVSMLGAANTASGKESNQVDWGKIAQAANSLNQTNIKKLSEASVLWVDDNPDNNTYERRALSALGINFMLSRSTDDAIQKIKYNKYDIVISDMGRGDDKTAGFKLLEAKQKLNDSSPFIIYSWGVSKDKIEMAKAKGAFGETSLPQELFQLVIDAIQGKQS